MGAHSGVGAYLSSSGSEVGAYSGGGLIREWGLNRSFTVTVPIASENSKENSVVVYIFRKSQVSSGPFPQKDQVKRNLHGNVCNVGVAVTT